MHCIGNHHSAEHPIPIDILRATNGMKIAIQSIGTHEPRIPTIIPNPPRSMSAPTSNGMEITEHPMHPVDIMGDD